MSYQTSIHFDPTALLIIKNEIDNSIKLVETAVNTLAEEQALPFGIDDALNQFEQCTQVLALIDMPHLAQITQYSAELMRQIMAQPQQIKTSDIVALSEGTTISQNEQNPNKTTRSRIEVDLPIIYPSEHELNEHETWVKQFEEKHGSACLFAK